MRSVSVVHNHIRLKRRLPPPLGCPSRLRGCSWLVSALSPASFAPSPRSGNSYRVWGRREPRRLRTWFTTSGTQTAPLAIPTSVGMAVPPHDQRILTVVCVVAAPDAVAFEPELLVEANRLLVRHAHLERVTAAVVVGRQLEQPLEQLRRDPAPLEVGIDRDVHHVPGIDVA